MIGARRRASFPPCRFCIPKKAASARCAATDGLHSATPGRPTQARSKAASWDQASTPATRSSGRTTNAGRSARSVGQARSSPGRSGASFPRRPKRRGLRLRLQQRQSRSARAERRSHQSGVSARCARRRCPVGSCAEKSCRTPDRPSVRRRSERGQGVAPRSWCFAVGDHRSRWLPPS